MAEKLHVPFGYNDGIPEGVKAAWGARWIIRNGAVDMVYDRQGAVGDQEERAALVAKLNGGILERAFRRADNMLTSGELRPTERQEVVLAHEDGVKVLANPNGSHGYLYVCAFFDPS